MPISEYSTQIYNLNAKLVSIKSLKRSHLSEADVDAILGPSKFYNELVPVLYRHMAQLESDPVVDGAHYKNLLEKKVLIARDLFHRIYQRNENFHFIQGNFPNGDVYFLGTAGHFVYIRAKNQKVYKGFINGDFTDEAILRADKEELEVRRN